MKIIILSMLLISCSSNENKDVIKKIEEACRAEKSNLSITVTLSRWGNSMSMTCSNIK